MTNDESLARCFVDCCYGAGYPGAPGRLGMAPARDMAALRLGMAPRLAVVPGCALGFDGVELGDFQFGRAADLFSSVVYP